MKQRLNATFTIAAVALADLLFLTILSLTSIAVRPMQPANAQNVELVGQNGRADPSTFTVTPTARLTSTLTLAPNTRIPLPAIDADDGWETRIHMQNVGDAPTWAAVCYWGAYSGDCPPNAPGMLTTWHKQYIPPNGVWTLHYGIPDGVYSAIVWSLLNEPAACPGVGTTATRGEPLAVTVNRLASNGTSASGTYNGFSETMLGTGPPHRYFAPHIMHGYNGLNTTLTIQNSGVDCTSLWIWYKEQGNCEYQAAQHIAELAPGEAIRIGPGPDADSSFPAGIVPPWMGSAYISATEPLAIVVDRWDADSAMLLTYTGVPYPDYGATTNYAPLVYRDFDGWNAEIHVQNMTRESQSTFVCVDFMDQSGDEILHVCDWVCRNGAITFYLSGIMDIPSPFGYVGTAEIQSLEQVDYPGGPPGEPIASVVSLINSDSGEALSYNALPSQQVEGVKTVILPHVAKEGWGSTSSIAIANMSNCVISDIRLDFYDETGTINYWVCQNTLRPWDLDYVDLANYGLITPGWVGDMVVTAVRSEDICEPGDYEPAIAAVVINRNDDGDSISGYEGSPFFDDYAPDGVMDCTPPSSGGATNYAPLFYREVSGWDTEIEVQNLSSSYPALVKVYFLDQSGGIITTMMDWILSSPPWNTRTFLLSGTDILLPRYCGAAVIQSQRQIDYPGPDPVADISSSVTLRELDTGQVITYDAFSLDQTLGVTEIDLPSLVKGYQGKSSEIAIRNNGDWGPKFKSQLEIYDDEGTEIEQPDLAWLHPRHLRVIRLEELEAIPTGFTGSGKVKVTEVQVLWPGYDQPNIAAIAVDLDTTPPTVTSTSPEDAATNVPIETVVTATFSEAMDGSTINADTFTLAGSAVPGAVTYISDTHTAIFSPGPNLDYDHRYTATLSTDITDKAGNPLAEPYTWAFTTAAPATVPYFSQRDPRWITHALRTDCDPSCCSSYCSTIGHCGCTLTSAAMLFRHYDANLDPASLSDCMQGDACPFDWGTGEDCSQGQAEWITKESFSWGHLENQLNREKRPVILGMYKSIEGQTCTHWVLVLSGSGSQSANYTIHDPWPLNGANMKLDAYNDWQLDSLAVYDGEPGSDSTVSVATHRETSRPQPVLKGMDSDTAEKWEVGSAARNEAPVKASSTITGSMMLYRMTALTMTVQLMANSEAGNVTEMMVWTDSMTQTHWQPYYIFATLPKSWDKIHARFRDEFGNTSDTVSDTSYPVGGPPLIEPTPVPVGGFVVPINKSELLRSWIILVTLAAVGAIGAVLLRRRVA